MHVRRQSGIDDAVLRERRRCEGLLLAEVGRQLIAGQKDIADALDAVITQMEQPGHVPDTVEC